MKTFLAFSFFLLLFFYPVLVSAQTEHIIGETTAEQVREDHPLFDVYTKRYQPDQAAIQYLSSISDSVKIFAMFGTWCHDSKRHLPELMKTLEVADNPLIDIEYLAVTKQKNDPEGIAKKLGLKLTPTFIIYYRDKEIGRIVEEPALKLEEDLVQILQSGLKADR